MHQDESGGPRRVLRVMTRLNVGGPARQANLLTRELNPFFPTVLAAGRPPATEAELKDAAVRVTYVSLVRNISPINDLSAFRSIRSLIVRHNVGLVHTHMAKAGTIGRIAARTTGRKPLTVHTFHGHVLDAYFSNVVEHVFIRIERTLARRTDALVAVSEEIKDQLLDLGIGRPSQWRVIPLGFELDDLLAIDAPTGRLRTHLALDARVPLIGVLGRLAPIKDHAMLIRAMQRIDNAHLAVLGDGELRTDLEAAARAAGLSHRIHFVGWWTDVPAAISDIDLMVLTSRNEGTPVSLIEASAGGRPVVATDVGGVRSVVQDGVTGFLVPPQDDVATATAISSLLANTALRQDMGNAGRAFVRERFSSSRLVADVKALYEELFSRRLPS